MLSASNEKLFLLFLTFVKFGCWLKCIKKRISTKMFVSLSSFSPTFFNSPVHYEDWYFLSKLKHFKKSVSLQSEKCFETSNMCNVTLFISLHNNTCSHHIIFLFVLLEFQRAFSAAKFEGNWQYSNKNNLINLWMKKCVTLKRSYRMRTPIAPIRDRFVVYLQNSQTRF